MSVPVEFWTDEPANSGVFVRCDGADDASAATCYEVNVYDQRPDPEYRTGAIVALSRSLEIQTVATRGYRLIDRARRSPGTYPESMPRTRS